MRKIFFLTLAVILASLLLPHAVFAQQAACDSIITDPSPVTTDQKTINITIRHSGLVDGNSYIVRLDANGIGYSGAAADLPYTGGAITINDVNPVGNIIRPGVNNPYNFRVKNYSVSVIDKNNTSITFCTGSFSVQQGTTNTVGGNSTDCRISFLNQTFTSNDDVRFKIETQDSSGERRIVVKKGGQSGSEVGRLTQCNQTVDLINEKNLGKLEGGNYYLEIQDCGNIRAQTQCYATFIVCPTCTIANTNNGIGAATIPPFKPTLCDPTTGQTAPDGKGIQTALGCIPTDTAGLIGKVFAIVLSLAGGIALLLIIYSGYKMNLARGNPEALQGARETLTSAVIGLLFIIFSFVILEIIGVDVLRLPGFVGSGNFITGGGKQIPKQCLSNAEYAINNISQCGEDIARNACGKLRVDINDLEDGCNQGNQQACTSLANYQNALSQCQQKGY